MRKIGIYVHIPFCKKKCKYCDFISFFSSDENIDKYFKCLEYEIENKKIDELKTNIIVNTIYFGGGTPSFPESKYIIEILNKIKKKFRIDDNAEITIEINPGTVNFSKLKDYKDAGFNRISIGLQSTENRLLELIGRIHSYEEFLETYNLVRKVGFDNVNVDLMLALPTQTLYELKISLNKVINLNPEHISLYSLILEEGTELKKLIELKKMELPSEEIERIMYWETKKILEQNGYIHYEISNFAKSGFMSKHNYNCWCQNEYVGYGLAAHSYFKGVRTSNTNYFDKYITNIFQNDIEKIINIEEIQDKESQKKEYILLSLRKIEGVNKVEFEKKFNEQLEICFKKEIDKLQKLQLINFENNYLKLTEKGLDFANIVFEEFI